MKVLIDVGHPAHVHLFKYFIKYLQSTGHTVVVTSRDKDITNLLLDQYGISYISISKFRPGFLGMVIELLIRDFRTFNLHSKFKFDVSFGTSVNITHLTALFGVPSYSFNEDDDSVVPLYAAISYPFATKIVIPETLQFRKWKKKRVVHKSSHKLAYLHSNHFTPNREVLKKYDLKEKHYIIVRNSALKAHHDVGIKGLDLNILTKLRDVIDDYDVIKSKEGVRNKNIDPWDMHDLLYFSKMLICDSQTMAMESAILGVPSIRITGFAKKLSYLNEVQDKYRLSFSFNPSEVTAAVDKIRECLNDSNADKKYKARSKKLQHDKGDFTDWMIDYFEKNINEKLINNS